MRSPSEIRKDLLQIRLNPVVAGLRRFGFSVRLFLGNDTRLEELIRILTDDESTFDPFASDSAALTDHVLEELIRRLHNYVASAGSLIAHTRRHPGVDAIPELADQVRAEVTKRFSENALVVFVNDLRNYTVHYELPLVVLNVRGRASEEGHTLERRLLLHPTELQESGYTWKKAAASYIQGATDDIDLDTLRRTYTNEVVAFQHWIGERLPDATKALLTRRNALAHELHLAMVPGFFDSVQALLDLVDRGIGIGEDVLRVLLRTEQIRDSRLRGETMEDLLRIIAAEYPAMPDRLVERIRGVIAEL